MLKPWYLHCYSSVQVISSLVTGVAYYVRVSARNSLGFGATQSSSPTFQHPYEEPTAPTDVVLGVTSDTMLTVSCGLSPEKRFLHKGWKKGRGRWGPILDMTGVGIPGVLVRACSIFNARPCVCIDCAMFPRSASPSNGAHPIVSQALYRLLVAKEST